MTSAASSSATATATGFPSSSSSSGFVFENPYSSGTFSSGSTSIFSGHSFSGTLPHQSTQPAVSPPVTAPSSYPHAPSLHSQLTVKLTSANFVIWRAQAISVIRGSGLAHHIAASIAPPSKLLADNSVNPAFVLWDQKDQQVLNVLLSSVSESLLPHIATASTALEAWNRLLTTHSSGARSQIRNLKAQLQGLQQGTDDIATFMIKGLDEPFRPFALQIETQREVVSFDHLFGLLLSEERRLASKKAPLLPTPTALYSPRQPPSNSNGNRNRGGRGRNSRGSHTGNSSARQPQFFSPGGSSYTGSSYSPQPGNSGHREHLTCHNCRGLGHVARNCSSPKFNRNYSAQPISNIATSSAPTQPWVMDSGATHHLTSDLGNMQLHSEYSGPDEVQIGLGNGQDSLQRPY